MVLEHRSLVVQHGERVARHNIDAGHKVALTAIATGDAIIKYGQVIGRASRDIDVGELHLGMHLLGLSGGDKERFVWLVSIAVRPDLSLIPKSVMLDDLVAL